MIRPSNLSLIHSLLPCFLSVGWLDTTRPWMRIEEEVVRSITRRKGWKWRNGNGWSRKQTRFVATFDPLDRLFLFKERKEAILRKNMERINVERINKSPKNASAFVFGSSTPRTLNQDLPSLESVGSGSSRSTNPASLNSVPPVLYRVRQQPLNINSPSDEKPFLRRVRPISAYASLSSVDQRMCEFKYFPFIGSRLSSLFCLIHTLTWNI